MDSDAVNVIKLDFDFKDLDEWENFYKFYKALFELSTICRPVVMETHKGFHIYCVTPLQISDKFAIRYYLGDDPWRLLYDEQRAKQASHLCDVLYEEKKTFYLFGRVREHYHEREMKLESFVVGDGIAYY